MKSDFNLFQFFNCPFEKNNFMRFFKVGVNGILFEFKISKLFFNVYQITDFGLMTSILIGKV